MFYPLYTFLTDNSPGSYYAFSLVLTSLATFL